MEEMGCVERGGCRMAAILLPGAICSTELTFPGLPEA